MSNSRYNGSGCKDLTAHSAIDNIEKKNKDVNNKARDLIKIIKDLISFAGFDVIGRIVIKDKETGKEYR